MEHVALRSDGRRPPSRVASSMVYRWVKVSRCVVVLRCTQRLHSGIRDVDDEPLTGSTTRHEDWYATLLRVGRRIALLFISERSGPRFGCHPPRDCLAAFPTAPSLPQLGSRPRLSRRSDR
jgi:hypothetical protein